MFTIKRKHHSLETTIIVLFMLLVVLISAWLPSYLVGQALGQGF